MTGTEHYLAGLLFMGLFYHQTEGPVVKVVFIAMAVGHMVASLFI